MRPMTSPRRCLTSVRSSRASESVEKNGFGCASIREGTVLAVPREGQQTRVGRWNHTNANMTTPCLHWHAMICAGAPIAPRYPGDWPHAASRTDQYVARQAHSSGLPRSRPDAPGCARSAPARPTSAANAMDDYWPDLLPECAERAHTRSERMSTQLGVADTGRGPGCGLQWPDVEDPGRSLSAS